MPRLSIKSVLPDKPAGRLTIYVGAAPGVGKTYKMLQDAHLVRQRGYDVVIGWLDTHGRKETEAQVQDLEIVDPKVVRYQGRDYYEMDLEALIARRPAVLLVDELAHSNIPQAGANAKRYQDVLDLLAAGIDVVTTVNIQHLESLYDKVAHITGIQVRERVPDSFVALAREIKLVDVSPETLQERLIQGQIYAPDKIELALSNFFQLGRLAALRELALVEVANNAERPSDLGDLAGSIAERRETILVCVSLGLHSEQLIRRGWRIADRLNANLVVLVVVEARSRSNRIADPTQEIERIRHLSAEFKAEVRMEPSGRRLVGEVIVRVAQQLGVSQIVIGQPQGRWRQGIWPRHRPVDYVLEHAEFVDLHVVGNGEGRT